VRITYDSRADALYIRLREGEFARNREVEPGVVLDIGRESELLGIEILNASARLDPADVAKVSIEIPLDLTQAA